MRPPRMSREQRNELLDAILDRASYDRGFRQLLMEQPKSAIHDEFGVEIPSSLRIKFIEKDPDVDSLVVLPDFLGDGELSDEDLEAAAGGTGSEEPPPDDWA